MNPLEQALGAPTGTGFVGKGLKAAWSPVLRVDLATSYGFPDGFLTTVERCTRVHAILVGRVVQPLVLAWKKTSKQRVLGLFPDGSLTPAKSHAGGLVAAGVIDPIAVRIAAWLGAAHDYPMVQPKAAVKLFLIDGASGWVAHVYDDRGMEVAFRAERDAKRMKRRLEAAGFAAA